MRALVRSLLPAIGVMLCASALSDTRYRVVDLGAPPGANYGIFPTSIDNQSRIVGVAYGDVIQAFFWDSKAGISYLPLPPGAYGSFAGRTDPTGRIAGEVLVVGSTQAAIWDAAHNVTLIGPTPIFQSSAGDIAIDGTIIGSFDFRPAVWAPDGSLSFLPAFSTDFPYGYAIKFNSIGQILGGTYNSTTPQNLASVWDRAHNLTTIANPPGTYSYGTDLNDQGLVAGYFEGGGYVPVLGLPELKGFLWNPGAGTTSLLPGLGSFPDYTYAEGINNRGQIVGSSIPPFGFFTSAVLWENGQIKDLNTLIGPYNGWFLSTADAINDKGEITGFGVFVDPANPFGPFLYRAYLLLPTR